MKVVLEREEIEGENLQEIAVEIAHKIGSMFFEELYDEEEETVEIGARQSIFKNFVYHLACTDGLKLTVEEVVGELEKVKELQEKDKIKNELNEFFTEVGEEIENTGDDTPYR